MDNLEKLKKELKKMRMKIQDCDNLDYSLGYASAISKIEGLVAEIKGKETHTEEAKRIVDYLNQKCGTKYKYKTENTQKHINARLRDGYTEEDFYTVIDKKSKEWIGTERERYLRPDTLFGRKFESYLNQKIVDDKGTGNAYIDIIKNRVDEVDKWE